MQARPSNAANCPMVGEMTRVGCADVTLATVSKRERSTSLPVRMMRGVGANDEFSVIMVTHCAHASGRHCLRAVPDPGWMTISGVALLMPSLFNSWLTHCSSWTVGSMQRGYRCDVYGSSSESCP